ncbi:MAG: site-specific integrase [Desulfatibacillum sp.]|nr:site-specific integrase [Desulfatibacillum sp.]
MSIMQECPVCHRKQATKNRQCKGCGEDLIKAKNSRRISYWISYILPDGKGKREKIGKSLKEAQAAHSKRMTQKRETPAVFEQKVDETMTFQRLSVWYLALPRTKSLAAYSRIELNIRTFNGELGDRPIKSLKPIDLENYQALGLAKGHAPAYVDQQIGTVRSMVNKAYDNDIVGGEAVLTFRRVKKILKKNGNARSRILSRQEFHDLMAELSPHVAAIVGTAYYTGMRRGEILPLTWDKVDLKRRLIHLESQDTKDKEPRLIPICEELAHLLSQLPRSIHDNTVFVSRGEPVLNIRNALRSAAKRAGIPYGRNTRNGFTFHDLRHTFNTNMRKAGVPESVIMKITGHSTREMFDRYNTVDMDDAMDAMDRMRAFLG